jgi:hypothetical protein
MGDANHSLSKRTPGAPIRFRTFLEPPLGPVHWSFESDRIDPEETTFSEAKYKIARETPVIRFQNEPLEPP